MKILLVWPQSPSSFWGMNYALKILTKKAFQPPLGLLTVAAMLPAEWEKKLVDMSVETLNDEDITWADYIFLGAMNIHKESAITVIDRCKTQGKKIVAGGSLFTAQHENFNGVDHFVLNESEITLPLFLEDLKNGTPKHLYKSFEWADVRTSPIPLWELINLKQYVMMSLQYSRGCPYDCDFCDVTILYGRKPRTKDKDQVIAELERLYDLGWIGHVFIADDNFIGNKVKVKEEILPAITKWMKMRKQPFTLSTQATINLADDEELIHMMVNAGFESVFIGIESPNEECISECRKIPNKNRDLISSVKKIQSSGLQIHGGFIVGFDNDSVSIFDYITKFIQESGIVTAMVGLLNAPYGTSLYLRLLSEGRLLQLRSGDNTDLSINFKPKMNNETLINGYKNILEEIYSPKLYYLRVKQFLENYKPIHRSTSRIRLNDLWALPKSILFLGVIEKERFYYWNLFFWSLFRKPSIFSIAIKNAIFGFHFRKIFEQYKEKYSSGQKESTNSK